MNFQGQNLPKGGCPPHRGTVDTYGAALVGKISFTLVFFAKSFRLALSMSVHVLVLSYSRMTNLSATCMTSSPMSRGAHNNVNNRPISYENALLSFGSSINLTSGEKVSVHWGN